MPITGTRPRSWQADPLGCRIHLPSKSSRPPDSRSDRSPGQKVNQDILCGICSAIITHRSQVLLINNRHDHAFFNPAGIAFELRCFRQAPGVSPHGEPSAEFTWFPGYRWQVVHCTACQAHLGWFFTSTQSFFGLIATRLVQ